MCITVGLWWSHDRCPAWCCADVVRFSLKQEAHRFILSLISPLNCATSSNFHQDGSGLKGLLSGMIEAKSQQGLLLALISLTCLGCVYAFCLCCKKRSIMQQEDNILYEQSEFSEDNSSFVQSETVIRQNLGPAPRQSTARLNCPRNEGQQQIHTSYQNLPNAGGTFEPTYVDPIPGSLYVNEDETDHGTYENVWRTTVVQHDSDSYDYENSEFLNRQTEDDSEYVNEVNEHR